MQEIVLKLKSRPLRFVTRILIYNYEKIVNLSLDDRVQFFSNYLNFQDNIFDIEYIDFFDKQFVTNYVDQLFN